MKKNNFIKMFGVASLVVGMQDCSYASDGQYAGITGTEAIAAHENLPVAKNPHNLPMAVKRADKNPLSSSHHDDISHNEEKGVTPAYVPKPQGKKEYQPHPEPKVQPYQPKKSIRLNNEDPSDRLERLYPEWVKAEKNNHGAQGKRAPTLMEIKEYKKRTGNRMPLSKKNIGESILSHGGPQLKVSQHDILAQKNALRSVQNNGKVVPDSLKKFRDALNAQKAKLKHIGNPSTEEHTHVTAPSMHTKESPSARKVRERREQFEQRQAELAAKRAEADRKKQEKWMK